MRKFIAIILSLAMLTAVTACGSKKEGLLFYVWGDNTELSWYEQVAANFTAETGTKVTVNRATGNYYDNLSINLGNKRNAPDVFFTEQGEFLSMLSSGRLCDLTPYIENGTLDIKSETNTDGKITLWDINDDYRYNGEVTKEGNYYAMIKDWSPDFMLWYNKSHIDMYNEENGLSEGDDGFMEYPSPDIPMSWSEFSDMSYKLTKRTGNTVSRYGTMLDRVPYKHLMEFIQMTGETTFIDGRDFNAQSEGVRDALLFFAQLQKGEKASSNVIGPTGIGSGEAFFNGNVSMVWFGSWAYSSYNWDSTSFEFGIAPPPVPDKETITAEDAYAVSAGMIALAVNNQSELKDEAVRFVNYYMTEGAEFFGSKGYNLPGNKQVADSDAFLYPDSAQLGEINRYFYNFAESYTHSIEYNKYISQITVENVFDKNISVWLKNYDASNVNSVLNDIARDIRNEIG